MPKRNAFYAQSGGVSAVINVSACGVLQTARRHAQKIGKVYAGRNGIVGALTEDLIDTSVESDAAIAALPARYGPPDSFLTSTASAGIAVRSLASYTRTMSGHNDDDNGDNHRNDHDNDDAVVRLVLGHAHVSPTRIREGIHLMAHATRSP